MRMNWQLDAVLFVLGLLGTIMGIRMDNLHGEPILSTVSRIFMGLAVLIRLYNSLLMPFFIRRLEKNMPQDPKKAMRSRMYIVLLTTISDVLTLGVRSARRNPFGPDEDPILDEPEEPVHCLVDEQPLPMDSGES